MAFNLEITLSAEKDLEEILPYITGELLNFQAAGHLLDEISKLYERLSDNPLIYPACSQPILQNFRKAIVMNYIVIYHVKDNNVYIDRIFSQLEDYVHKM